MGHWEGPWPKGPPHFLFRFSPEHVLRKRGVGDLGLGDRQNKETGCQGHEAEITMQVTHDGSFDSSNADGGMGDCNGDPVCPNGVAGSHAAGVFRGEGHGAHGRQTVLGVGSARNCAVG